MSARKSLYLIDGHGQIYRCYYAPFRELTSPTGEPTKATYVFCQMLLNLASQRRPDYLAMVMDVSTETLQRRQIYQAYKAQRPPQPEDLPPQTERIVSILQALGVPVLQQAGFEADDLIATIVRQVRQQHDDVDIFLVSRDKDLDQLLGDRVCMYDPGKDELIDADRLEALKGFSPAEAIEVQALTGDSTDNIPGVPGVGPKTAARLVRKYGSAEAVIAHADQQSPKLSQNLKAFADTLPLAKALVRLRDDLPIDFQLEACRFKGIDPQVLRPIFEQLGFSRLLRQLEELAAPSPVRPEAAPSQREPARLTTAEQHADYRLVETVEQLAALASQLAQAGSFAFDTETTALNPIDAELVGLSFAFQPGQAYYVPVRSASGRTVPLAEVTRLLGPVLRDPKLAKCGQNLKYDLIVLRQAGIEVAGADFDTMIASFVLDATRRSHGIDALARELLGYKMIPITDLIGKGRKQLTIDQVDPALLCRYAAEDADIALRLRQVLEPQLDQAGLRRLFAETEMPLVEVLAEMEYNGVAIDTDQLARLSNELADRIRQLARRIHAAAGHEFNIDSTRQLATVLFDELNLPVIRKTKTARSTDAETLATLAWQSNHPLPQLVLEYRELTKLKNTYIDTLPEMISPRTGRVHASFNQTGTVTGRLSSSDPNLQNIPIRTEQGRQIRRAFVPSSPDNVLLTADYSQIELRVLAHFCQDQALLQAFHQDQDIHAFVAAEIFGLPIQQVSPEQRSRAKAVNFGVIYGQTPYGLSRSVGIPLGQARTFIETYFLRYPGIRRFLDASIAKARKLGYVQTILGRRRRIEQIHSTSPARRALGERLVVNTIIQGSAADLIKTAMINIHRRLKSQSRPLRMLIQVHDELVFELPRSAVDAEAEIIRHQMTTAMPLAVPIKVDIAWGPNWLESK